MHVRGFLTEEVRGAQGRTGFHVRTWDGHVGWLARVGSGAGPHVGRYVVDLPSFEAVALPALAPDPPGALLVVDEVGRMECLSRPFQEAMRRLLSAPVPLLATVALKGGGLIEELKHWPGTELLEVTRSNRDALPEQLARSFQEPLGAQQWPLHPPPA